MSETRRRSLRLELIATLSVILMVAVVSLSLATELLGSRRHSAAQQRQLSSHAQGLSALVTPRLSGDVPDADIEQVLRASIGSLGIEAIEILRLDGDRALPALSIGLAPGLPPPESTEATLPEHIFEHDDLIIVDRTLRTFGADRSRGDLVLRIIARPAPWTRVQDWQEILVLAVGVGAVVLTLGILLLELQVLRPLGHVRSAVGAVAMGDLEARVPEEGPTELQALAGAFNRMADSLQAQRDQLVRNEQLASVGRVSAGIAHEVGNPLAAILGYVELLLDPRSEPPLSEEQRSLLERSREQIQRIQGIVAQLLEYSRPSKQRREDVAVVEAARLLLQLLQHDPRCKDVQLDVEGDPETTAHVDAALLDQVLHNLVVNGARAATEVEGRARVRIWVERDGDRVHIDVQDSGRGVPEKARARLFEPFFTTAKAGQGTGLGLAICQGLVQSMGGELDCRPRGARDPLPGARFPGAVFRVTLHAV